MQQSKAIVITKGIPFRLTASALCVALAIITSSVFHVGDLPGNMFLPMHIPIIVCGFVCGHKYGVVAGLITPILSHIVTPGRPPVPVVYFMTFELAAYGFFAGLFYRFFFKHKKRTPDDSGEETSQPERKSSVNTLIIETALIIGALILSMILGRIAFGIARFPVFGASGFGLAEFMRSMFVTSLPGIIVQIVFIPVLVQCLRRGKIIE